MIEITCSICGGRTPYTVLYPESIKFEEVDENTFSARRIPEKVHYRIVKCEKCGLVYSNPILEPSLIEKLYKKSKFNYDNEVENIKLSYGHYLDIISPYVKEKGRLLEIGCGNGFFLEKALALGYRDVYGVEPSSEAVAKAKKDIRPNIINDILKSNQFKKDEFDVVCFFQVLDHITDPNEFLKLCFEYLKKEGVVLCITHNVNSFSARLMAERSPIIDIEHIFLFNEKTLRRLFEKNNFKVIKTFNVYNTYTLGYWARLLPLPRKLKKLIIDILIKTGLGALRVRLKPGNIGIIAKKNS